MVEKESSQQIKDAQEDNPNEKSDRSVKLDQSDNQIFIQKVDQISKLIAF